MAGRLTIQRYPRGLLDLLGMKTSGDNPVELDSTVKGVVDLSYMYQYDKVEMVQAFSNVVNLTGVFGTNGVQATVPAGQLWLLHNLTASQNNQCAAGEAYEIQPAIYRNNWSIYQLGPSSTFVSGAGQRCSVGWQFERPEIMRPNDNVGLYCTKILAGASQFTFSLYFTRLNI